MSEHISIVTDDIDAPADQEIYECLNPTNPKSFFLFAGAGSGKTRSLVNAIDRFRVEYGRKLWLRGQNVGVITYTNAACEEIQSRLKFDPLVEVSTIHSFAWSLIDGYNADIRDWLVLNLNREIKELVVLQARGRANSQAAVDRARSIESKTKRLEYLNEVKTFVYSPTGDNRGRDALNHSEVIGITSSFLMEKQALQRILTSKYPILLIDESQDTNRHLMDSLLSVQALNEGRFCLGLFGDTMQRIYADGKAGLGENLPPSWARPAKQMNHRCPPRVIRLINKIRASVDAQTQTGRSDRPEGTVRLFILPNSTQDRFGAEAIVTARMAKVTGDTLWTSERSAVKTLILEHHMAARRMGFLDLFEALYPIERVRTGLLDGSLAGLRLFANEVLPLVTALRNGDEFAAAAIVRKHSPLLDRATLKLAGRDQPKLLRQAKDAADALLQLWRTSNSPLFIDVLKSISKSGLFDIPEPLRTIAARQAGDVAGTETDADDTDELSKGWEALLAAPFQQIEPYSQYVKGEARFDTHQGVKGREFPRVMVIMDDDEARGFLFNYDKLFGVKAKSKTDLEHERNGEETSIDRTRRLFYVTCSRAKESLAIVAYSGIPSAVRASALNEGWFEDGEIEMLSAPNTD